jgi:putative transposase
MLKNHCLAKGISSVAWSECVRQLKYKADWLGKNIIFIDRFDPSSKTCNYCGYVNKELKLSDRSWICPNCSSNLDRDINTAINIKNFALAKIS